MKRKADVEGRRRILCDAAIQLLADEGAKGLTHRKVEQQAGLPDGTTSSYFRTRSALLRATAERVAELDAAEFETVMQRRALAEATTTATTLSLLADMVIRSATGPGLDRSRARYELALHAHRDEVLQRAIEDAIAGFVALSEEAVTQLQPGPVDRALVEKQARAITTFINGVIVRQVFGHPGVDSAEELTQLLHALVAGVAASHHVHNGQF
ncbi:TetR/AcrR family transcriptional regulator [Mycobacterium sp. Aquia_213]|uniref:TetR/AcrR family transcriptional regulator n=1 Tax=Mycobacterium sp. Aquia_213 TaxID=2991728 RepID=UPI00226EEC93|nr:TetR/AcrR family transcriptional regulator [Mycobacterium sp. Aquia_213]WAC91850.1 TetR family transcriptional regulator [Mycobacterium sp. Aquia_213]